MKTASLTAGLVKKGHATPSAQPNTESLRAADDKSMSYYKSLTVKLDRERYESLKSLGVKLDKKSQQIFVEALDLYLRQKTC
jgi:type II secretory pathway component GspD/PulD (secretin)